MSALTLELFTDAEMCTLYTVLSARLEIFGVSLKPPLAFRSIAHRLRTRLPSSKMLPMQCHIAIRLI